MVYYNVLALTSGEDGSEYRFEFIVKEPQQVFTKIRHTLEMEEATEQILISLKMLIVERPDIDKGVVE